MLDKELLKGLTSEQIAKAKGCKNKDELLAMAQKEGVELTEQQLESVNGGCSSSPRKCAKCGCEEYTTISMKQSQFPDVSVAYKCKNCKHIWNEGV